MYLSFWSLQWNTSTHSTLCRCRCQSICCSRHFWGRIFVICVQVLFVALIGKVHEFCLSCLKRVIHQQDYMLEQCEVFCSCCLFFTSWSTVLHALRRGSSSACILFLEDSIHNRAVTDSRLGTPVLMSVVYNCKDRLCICFNTWIIYRRVWLVSDLLAWLRTTKFTQSIQDP